MTNSGAGYGPRPRRWGTCFPDCLPKAGTTPGSSNSPPLMEATPRWLARHTPGPAELLRLMDGTPIPCSQSKITTQRSHLFGYAGYGYCSSHSHFYRGAKLMLIVTADGTVTGFGLGNPKLFGEREQTRKMLTDQPANRPEPGTAVITDKGLSGEDIEEFFHEDPGLLLVRPARKDQKKPRPFPNWLRQRVEAWTIDAPVKRSLIAYDH